MSLNRLQKIISDSDLLYRLRAYLLIKEGKLTLNVIRSNLLEKADPFFDHILWL